MGSRRSPATRPSPIAGRRANADRRPTDRRATGRAPRSGSRCPAGRWARNQREWCTSAACDPNRKNSSSPTRATENSPTMRPCGLSIAVSAIRPTLGRRLVNNPCSQSALPAPDTLYLAKFEHSVRPTRSRTARHSSATSANALERRNVTSSTGSSPRTLEPQRMLEPEAGAPDGVVLGEPVIDGSGVKRPGGGELLVRERDPEPPAVVLAHLGVGVGEVRPVAEAGDVHRPDVHAGVTLGHPGGERQAHATALRQPGHHGARHPAVADARGSARRAGCRRVRT